MAPLTQLTPAQEAQLSIYREKWLAIGLSTEPTNRQGAEEAIDLVYQCGGLPPPSHKIWLANPLHGAIAAAMLTNERHVGTHGGTQVQAQIYEQVAPPVQAEVFEQVGAPVQAEVEVHVGSKIYEQVATSLRKQVLEPIREPIWELLLERAREQTRQRLWDQVGQAIGHNVATQIQQQVIERVWEQIGANIREPIRQRIGAQAWYAGFGLHDASWIASYDFFQAVCGIHGIEGVNGFIALAQHAGWFWPFENAVILTDRPSALRRDPQHRLHAEDRMAIEYPDGWGIYAWHGVRVPEIVILHPLDLTVQDIQQEANVEVRRVMLTQYGEARYLLDSGATKVQEDRYGALYRMDLHDDEPLVMVRVLNSTPEPTGEQHVYWLRVAPQCRTAHEAVAWSFGLTTSEYAPMLET